MGLGMGELYLTCDEPCPCACPCADPGEGGFERKDEGVEGYWCFIRLIGCGRGGCNGCDCGY